LDDDPSIQTLIERKGWKSLPEFDRIGQICRLAQKSFE